MLMLRSFLIAAGLWCGISVEPLFGAPDLAAAQVAFDAGDYDRAITLYESAAQLEATNGHLLYNLGIAYFRKERLGDAMAAFLGARRLLPRDPDVKANLNFVTAKIRDKLETEQPTSGLRALTFWTRTVTARELATGFAVTALAASLCLGLAVLVPRCSKARPWALLSLLVPLVLAICLAVSLNLSEQWGAVTAQQTTIYSGPDKSTVLFELQEGAPFLAGDRSEQGFWLITLSDGKKGWVAGADVKVF